MIDVSRIANADKVLSVYHRWPKFHDATIVAVRLDRGLAPPRLPSLEFAIHAFDCSSEVDERGYYRTVNHSLVALLFKEVDCLSLDDFDWPIVIFSLDMLPDSSDADGCDRVRVELQLSYGMAPVFSCRTIEVVDVVPCNCDGSAISR